MPFSKAMDGVPDLVSEREARRNSTPNVARLKLTRCHESKASEAMETPMETVNVEKPDATNALPGDNALWHGKVERKPSRHRKRSI